MPDYFFNTGDPEVVKLFSKKLWSEYRKRDSFLDPSYGFTGSGDDFMFILCDEPQKSVGDKVTVPYSFQITNEPGVGGNEILEGKEGGIDIEPFSLTVDKQRHGVKTMGEMNEQRVHFNTIEEAKRKLLDWWKTRRAVVIANQLCGNTAQTNRLYTGMQLPSAPDSDHIVRPGVHATDQAVAGDTAATFDVDLIDEIVTRAELLTPPIRPIMYKGNPYYALFLHSNQVRTLRENNSQWYNTMQNALQGGRVDDNPLFTRALGKWRDTLIFSDPYITRGVNSSTGLPVDNTRRAVFCGASALAVAYGRHYQGGENPFRWFSSDWDHGDKYYASASLIWGCKAVRINVNGTERDIGKIVVTTYAEESVTIGNLGQP